MLRRGIRWCVHAPSTTSARERAASKVVLKNPAAQFCFAQIAKPGPRRKEIGASIVTTSQIDRTAARRARPHRASRSTDRRLLRAVRPRRALGVRRPERMEVQRPLLRGVGGPAPAAWGCRLKPGPRSRDRRSGAQYLVSVGGPGDGRPVSGRNYDRSELRCDRQAGGRPPPLAAGGPAIRSSSPGRSQSSGWWRTARRRSCSSSTSAESSGRSTNTSMRCAGEAPPENVDYTVTWTGMTGGEPGRP